MAEEKDSKSGKPSSYEKPPLADGPTDADDWPNGLKSWPAVLLTAGFVALFKRNTFESWQAAIKLVRTAPTDVDVDLRLLPADRRADYLTLERLWLTFWSADNDITPWKVVPATDDGGPDDAPNERLIVSVYDILQLIRTKLGHSDTQSDETIARTFLCRAEEGTFGADLQQVVGFRGSGNGSGSVDISAAKTVTKNTLHNFIALAGLSGQHIAISTDRPSTVFRIVGDDDPSRLEPIHTDDAFYAALNTTCSPLCQAVWQNNVVVAIELLKALPVLELDVYGFYPVRTETGGESGWQSPEYWSQDDRFELRRAATWGATGTNARFCFERCWRTACPTMFSD
jgi:hypothetical protein